MLHNVIAPAMSRCASSTSTHGQVTQAPVTVTVSAALRLRRLLLVLVVLVVLVVVTVMLPVGAAGTGTANPALSVEQGLHSPNRSLSQSRSQTQTQTQTQTQPQTQPQPQPPSSPTQGLRCMPLPTVPPNPRHPGIENRPWLLAEVSPTGLCNQLFGVFAYVPLALLYKTHLVVSVLYSRSSFDETFERAVWTPFPMSALFNFEHFQASWADRGVVIVDGATQHNNCLRLPSSSSSLQPTDENEDRAPSSLSSFNLTIIQRQPAFWPQPDDIVLSWKPVNSPLQVHQTTKQTKQTPQQLWAFNGTSKKFITAFDFRQSSAHQRLLAEVSRSLVPAKPLQAVIDALQTALPTVYIAAHLRVEGDVARLHEDFVASLDRAVKHLLASPCLKPYLQTTDANKTNIINKSNINKDIAHNSNSRGSDFQQMPSVMLYIASGVFAKPKTRKSKGFHVVRTKVLVDALKRHGVIGDDSNGDSGSRVTVTSREALLRGLEYQLRNNKHSRHNHRNSNININSNTNNNNNDKQPVLTTAFFESTISQLLPEQEAFVDLWMARRAVCFVPSHVGSTFSYFAKRLQYLDRISDNVYGEDDARLRPLDRQNATVMEDFGPSIFANGWGL